jgi:WD40 repeat protein
LGKESLNIRSPEQAYSIAFSPDGRLLAAGGSQDAPQAWVWDAESGKELMKLDAR